MGPVPKADGTMCLCSDYKVTINPVLKWTSFQYLHQRTNLQPWRGGGGGGEKFTKLDQQVVLEPASHKYVTINTYKGLHQYTRLPFGVASASTLFQQIMETVLQGIWGVVVYLNDIFILGRTEREHINNLQEVLQRKKKWVET